MHAGTLKVERLGEGRYLKVAHLQTGEWAASMWEAGRMKSLAMKPTLVELQEEVLPLMREMYGEEGKAKAASSGGR